MSAITILGSTGSIGTQALDVIARHAEQFHVVGLAAGGSRLALLAEQTVAFDPGAVAIVPMPGADEASVRAEFERHLEHAAARSGRPVPHPDVDVSISAPARLASVPVDVVLNGITGSAGLQPTLAALAAGSRLALANKESLIVGGNLVLDACQYPDQITPVDSEHSALAQCLRSGADREVCRLILTASGGPFRGWSRERLADVTVEQALAHPTWAMGPVVTINSATMMNKALEVIEAHLLFGIPMDRIDVVVHPQSVVHSMVEFVDGATIAQASPPDMRLPIGLALSWPQRMGDVVPGCDWSTATQWTFEPLDEDVFKAITLARNVGSAGGTLPAVFNAANEECVDAFRNGVVGFLDIVETVDRVVSEAVEQGWARPTSRQAGLTLEEVLDAERRARSHTQAMLVGEN